MIKLGKVFLLLVHKAEKIHSVGSEIEWVLEIWRQDKDKEINKGKDQRQKTKTNHII